MCLNGILTHECYLQNFLICEIDRGYSLLLYKLLLMKCLSVFL